MPGGSGPSAGAARNFFVLFLAEASVNLAPSFRVARSLTSCLFAIY
jgi:hypothetical protein